ncbi:P4 phage protein [Escherichia coli]|nr:P4 phage protein [Escherichia coli]
MQSSVTGRKTNENTLTARLTRSPLPSRCRLCLADRVRTSARYPHLTLESLEAAIAAELEGFYLRQHGEEKGRQIACALLEDLMESGPLKAAPSLSFLGWL